ncbi:mannitol dehydrogenase family protein [Histidinibacterium lentulum]|uniref:Mannitol dehydrogenase family protein n=1 Tax=Histidinibacterium lentulum TaxID=2480588 RepID=A0A3N2QYR9_9RHOB|nr:mannitol dehydrogenase family protein [Histidinibacterium lentulum]ROU00352.1 mannitol dehydrogenase family protein [Histidinibacterium lentulum]
MEAVLPDVPRLSRSVPAAKVGIVHLGPGAFFRSFGAIFTEDAMAAHGGDWGICAVSLRSPSARDQLGPQEGVYTSVTLAPEGRHPRVIGSVSRILVAPEDPQAVLDAMTAPDVRIVSLTITEKGYCHEPSTGLLRLEHPDIRADIEAPSRRKSAPGLVVEALARRRAEGHPPFTVLSCDNLPDNGRLVRGVVLDLARVLDPALAAWIEQTVRFPATMVDRITPATTVHDIAGLARSEGYHDPACVVHEPFRQWVIEDDFTDGARPAWDAAGAQFVRDVAPFETMKLRCLNGTHSALAYLGYLAGHGTIADAVADPPFAALCRHLWEREILPTVPQPEGEDLVAYCDALLDRYRNPAICHRTWQIAMDGSQKLPQRLLGTVQDNLAEGRPVPGLALAVAAWMRYVGGVDEAGGAIDVRDPLADRLKAASEGADEPSGKVAALLAVGDVFPSSLASDRVFREAVSGAYEGLCRIGARAMVVALTGAEPN